MITTLKFKLLKNYRQLFIILAFVSLAIVVNTYQVSGLTSGDYNVGELLLIMFNDSYTSYYVFPFLYFFLAVTLFEEDPNLYYVLVRFPHKKKYVKEKFKSVLVAATIYILLICLLSILSGLLYCNWGTNYSEAFKFYMDNYLVGISESNVIFVEIVKLAMLQYILYVFFGGIIHILLQLRISKAFAFCIFFVLILVASGMSLGFWGIEGELASLYLLAGSVYPGDLNFIMRVMCLLLLSSLIWGTYLFLFLNMDLKLAKGNKQYVEGE